MTDLLAPWRKAQGKVFQPPVEAATVERALTVLRSHLRAWQKDQGDTVEIKIDEAP